MKDPRKARPAAVDIRRAVYAMATTDGQSAEITMYGDIYEQRPTDWYGNPVEGEFVLLSDFMEDLEQIASCKDITIRMNSYGGDAGVSITIHNRLRELARAGATLTCIVDGVAMSGGSLIMCACDTVKVNPSSLVMIHKCWTFLFGGYNADEMRELAARNDAWDKAQVSIYKRKTGASDTVLSHMMSDTTYMTGSEAVDKGFADEVLDGAEPLGIAASADGRCLFVRGRALHLAPGMFAPDNIPTVTPEASAPDMTNTPRQAQTAGGKEGNTMAAADGRGQSRRLCCGTGSCCGRTHRAPDRHRTARRSDGGGRPCPDGAQAYPGHRRPGIPVRRRNHPGGQVWP